MKKDNVFFTKNVFKIILFVTLAIGCSLLQVAAITIDNTYNLGSTLRLISKVLIIAGLIIYAMYFVNFKEKKYPLDLRYQAYTLLIIAVNIFVFMKDVNGFPSFYQCLVSLADVITSIIIEELLFRIIAVTTFKSASNSVSPSKIIVISSLYALYVFLFVLTSLEMWPDYLVQMLYAFFFGFFLLTVYLNTNNIKYTTAINAAVKGLILLFSLNGSMQNPNGEVFAAFAMLIALLMYASIGFFILKDYRNLK